MLNKALNILKASIFEFILVIISYKIIVEWSFEIQLNLFAPYMVPMNKLFSALIIAPLFETFLFIYIPFQILRNTEIFERNIWLFAALSGIIFGWIHGSYFNIFLQGISGFAFAWVYIKNQHSYISAALCHFLHNFIVFIIGPILFQ